MSIFAPTITRIKGLSDRRRLPRLGKIRLGFKIKKGNIEYPAELPFFLLPPDAAKTYGFKDAETALNRANELGITRQDVIHFIADNAWRLAEEIEIMFPINEIESVFPQAYKWYGSQRGVKCMGDGERAMRYDETSKAMVEIQCPCENLKTDENPKGECTQRGHLMVLLPKVNMGGVWQIDCGSYNSIVDINSGLDYVSALVGRFALIPLVLRRIPTQTHHDGKKQVHFTMQLLLNVPISELEGVRKDTSRILQHTQYALPAPEDINPILDVEGEVVIEEKVIEDQGLLGEQKIPKKSDYVTLLNNCKSAEELQILWAEIMQNVSVLSNEEKKTLNILKESKKAELQKPPEEITIQEPFSEQDVAFNWKQIETHIQQCETIEQLDLYFNSLNLKGKDKTKLIRIRDKQATKIRSLERINRNNEVGTVSENTEGMQKPTDQKKMPGF